MTALRITVLALLAGLGSTAVIGGMRSRLEDGGPLFAGIGVALLIVAVLLYSRWRAHIAGLK